MVKILKINGFASIQDGGRFGHRKLGINTNGAMDLWALQLGNAILNNPLHTEAIELALGSLQIEFHTQTYICLTGAYYQAELIHATTGEKMPVYQGWRYAVQSGDILDLQHPLQVGMYAYLCVSGGLGLPTVLDSCSTNISAMFGGQQGRLLVVNDEFTLNPSAIKSTPLAMSPFYQSNVFGDFSDVMPKQTDAVKIRIIQNTEYNAFTPQSQKLFGEQVWQVSNQSNRMGYRLKSTTEHRLMLTEPLQMNSHGVAMGMIQVPPQGEPIVLMADAQTTGGYPKIASVIRADLGRFAQLRAGQHCQFIWVDLEHALHAYQQRIYHIKKVQRYAKH